MKNVKKAFSQILLALIFIVLIISLVQNLSVVIIHFLNWKLEIPVFVALILIYILGAISGSLLFGLIRSAVGGQEETKQEEKPRRDAEIDSTSFS